MMERSGLNINRPLLSVRRVSSTTPSPKNENRRTENRAPVRPNVGPSKTELKSDPLMNTGSVPFGWEHSPGKPKDKQIQTKINSPSIPKLPPGRFITSSKKDLDTRFDSGASTSKQSCNSGNDHDDEDDDDSEAFMDAVDTLSRSETSFYNCSVGSDIKPSGIIPNDPKMREFMMGRFLPAAKAIASNVSQHTSKKNVIKEKQQEFKKLMDDKKGQLRYGPNFLEDVSHDNEDDDDDSDSDYHDQNHSSKFCGLIPRFCSVNPVHGMCMRTKLTTKFTTSTASSSTVSSITGSDNEPARTGMYERRSWNGVLKSKSTETINLEGSKLYNRLQGRAVSVSFSEPIRSSFPEENPKNSKKKALSFKELLADKNTKETDEEDEDLMVEKTLYVDTVQTVKSPSQSNFDKWSESDDESKDGMKRKTCTKSCKDYEDFDLFDEKFGDLGLKGYECKGFELPAPPSDSWLCRTLPLKSSKNTPCQWDPIISPSSNTVASDQNADVDIRSPSPQGPLDSIPEN